jgi:uncharacterized protein (DUF1810 family)
MPTNSPPPFTTSIRSCRKHPAGNYELATVVDSVPSKIRASQGRIKMPITDSYNLQRFLDAQSRTFDRACAELRNGRKESHWMWFIFPQLKGLGHSPMANLYGVSSTQEAEAYLTHPILGSRLRQITQIVLLVEGRSIKQIFGAPDDLKFRSSMTLFANTCTDNQLFKDALTKYFQGKPDQLTLDRL